MATAIDEMVITDEDMARHERARALLRFCRMIRTLAVHPDMAPALVNNDVGKIVEHLRQQRRWLYERLSADTRDRMEYRKSPASAHARAACSALSIYESYELPKY